MTPWLAAAAEGTRLAVTAAPRASKTEIAGVAGDRLRIRLAAPPVDGAANDELVRFLARALGVPRAAVTIAAGAAGKRKTVVIQGVAPDDARRRLGVPL